MIRFIKGIFIFIIILILLLPIVGWLAWISVPYWITPLSKQFLPPDVSITVKQRPQFIGRGVNLFDIGVDVGQCRLAELTDFAVTYRDRRLAIVGKNADVDTQCLFYLTASEEANAGGNGSGAPLSLASLQRSLPPFDIQIDNLNITPWQQYHGGIELHNDGNQQTLRYRSDLINAEASLNDRQELTVSAFELTLPDVNEKLTLNGSVSVPIALDRIPENGRVSGTFNSQRFEKPLTLDLSWRDLTGNLTIKEQDGDDHLLNLPWRLTGEQFTIEQGQWRWPYSYMPLSGGVNLTLSDWARDYSSAQFKARLYLLTSGHGGKATLVMNLGPDPISLLNNNIRFQLTGKASLENIAAYITVPGAITDNLLDPIVRLRPGSLVRATGNVSPDITLHEARFPLAGVYITTAGINGPLQAIVNASHRQWGNFKVHLDGKAQQFLPDKGLWEWRFWGDGNLPQFQSTWDVAGRGRWQDATINIDTMSTGLNQFAYGNIRVQAPRFSLTKPLVWRRDAQQFNTDVQLLANRVTFANGGYLPKTLLTLTLNGSSPNNFVWNGQLAADPIGPIRLNGRWDGERLRGQGWWPNQSLRVFQSLLEPNSDVRIRSGQLRAQAAFSAAQGQGFEAGGHVVVSDGSLWLKDGQLNGLDFTASYRYQDHRWQLGTKEPIKLKIAQIDNLFDMRNITANLQGSYPYTNKRPLILNNVAVDMLGGHVSMNDFRLPVREATTLKVERVELSELFTVLKPKQVAMSGKVSGELPVYIDNPNWLVRNGWIENDGYLTLRLDQQFVDAIGEDDIATGAVIDWLRYVEISRSRADINVSNLGILTMDVQIKGVNSVKSKERPVILNYRHEENIFQLWRSLRFGDNLQDWVEQQLTHPRRDKK